MSQHSFSIANEVGSAFRADVNAALQALASCSRGAAAPGTTYAGQVWDDSTANVQKKRNAANAAWIVKMTLDETFVLSRSSNTILGLSDYGKCIVATGTFTQTVTAAATLTDGWWVEYRNDGVGIITIDPNGAETIDGATTILLQPGEGVVINCNGSAFKTVGRQTGWVLLASLTASSSATLDFINLTGYAGYVFQLHNIVPATTNTDLWLRISQDNGVSFKSGAGDYRYAAFSINDSALSGTPSSTGDTKYQLDLSISNAAGDGCSGTITSSDLATTSKKHFRGHFSRLANGGGNYWVLMSMGVYVTDTNAINAIRFLMSSGNIASGTIKCYGLRP